MVNWKSIGLGFIITFAYIYLSKYVPYLDMSLAPILGGIFAGYMVGGSFKNGALYGGFSAGIVGFIYALLVIILSNGIARATSVSMVVFPISSSGISEFVTAGVIILGATIAFVIYFIMGLIGGIIGVAIKERNAEKQILKT